MRHIVLLVFIEATLVWQFANHRCVDITLDNNTSVFSVYQPTRSGCTYNFKESLDTLQVIKKLCTQVCLVDLLQSVLQTEQEQDLDAFTPQHPASKFYTHLSIAYSSLAIQICTLQPMNIVEACQQDYGSVHDTAFSMHSRAGFNETLMK